ncbi:MAG: hypothetical protein INH41_07105 [Myxococcaceae bacterium]|jgi:hypothetical protein|nr:hypothetical protein [Myxococcaceae bacterium]
MSSSLVRLVQSGGPQARAAATSLLDSARAGTLKPAEVAEVKVLLQRPELADVFSGGLGRDLQAALGGGRAPVRDVGQLTGSPGAVTDPRALPKAFGKDLLVQRQQLVDPRLPPDENAERLLAFFSPYAERFVELTRGPEHLETPVARLPPEDQAKALKQFEKALTDGGFGQLVERQTGRDGVALGRALLESKTPDEVRARLAELNVDAPGWRHPNNPHAAMTVAVAPAQERTLRHEPPDEALAQERRGRRGTLGRNLLWNALHLLREGAETDEEKAAMNELLVAAGLLLGFVAVMAAVLLLTL